MTSLLDFSGDVNIGLERTDDGARLVLESEDVTVRLEVSIDVARTLRRKLGVIILGHVVERMRAGN